jgi:hypothetical protein
LSCGDGLFWMAGVGDGLLLMAGDCDELVGDGFFLL